MIWDRLKKSPGFKNISVLGSSTIVGNGITSIFWIYLADLLGAEKYGELGYLMAIATIVSNVCLVGGTWSMTVYTAKGMKIQPPLYVISLISSCTSLVIIFVIFNTISIGIYVIGFVIFQLFLAELLGFKLFKRYGKFYIFQKITFVCLAFSFNHFMGFEGIIIAYGLSYLIFSFPVFKMLTTVKPDFGIFKTKFGFLTNNYLYDLSSVANGQIDKLIIAPMFGFILLGNYYLGLQIIGFLGILPGIVFNYILPQDATGHSTTQVKKITLLFSVGFTLIGIFLIPPLMPIVFPEFTEAVTLLPILSLSVIPIAIQSIFTSKLLGQEKTKYILMGYLISISILFPGIIILGNEFGAEGIAISFVLSQTATAIFLVLAAQLSGKKNE
tara:strand:+ start:327 stop:1481 length:1155 start_codon:yes stop_codon:yes gene_type:complete